MQKYCLRVAVRGHLEKGVSVTRVLIEGEAMTSKAVLGSFTLAYITEGQASHGKGIGSMLVTFACQLARGIIVRTSGVGLVVDAADEGTVEYDVRYGFFRVVPAGSRMFLPRVSLEAGAEIQLGGLAAMDKLRQLVPVIPKGIK